MRLAQSPPLDNVVINTVRIINDSLSIITVKFSVNGIKLQGTKSCTVNFNGATDSQLKTERQTVDAIFKTLGFSYHRINNL